MYKALCQLKQSNLFGAPGTWFRMDQLMNSCIFYASMCFDRDELSVLMMTSDDL